MIFSYFLLLLLAIPFSSFFFFNDTATTEIYTLSLHDALPILYGRICTLSPKNPLQKKAPSKPRVAELLDPVTGYPRNHKLLRSEEHTSELQSRLHLVCRLLLEKKKKKK